MTACLDDSDGSLVWCSFGIEFFNGAITTYPGDKSSDFYCASGSITETPKSKMSPNNYKACAEIS